MTIAFISSQNDSFASGGASKTASFNPGAGDFLVVKITAYDNSGFISGVTFGGNAMTHQVNDDTDGSSGQHERATIYTRVITPGGGAQNVVVSFSPGLLYGCNIISESWSGVDSTTPVGNKNAKYKENVSITSPYTVTLTISANNVASDVIFINPSSITRSGGQTNIYTGLDAGGGEYLGASYKAGASSDMSWTYTGSPTRAAIAAIEIKASAGAVLAATITSPTSSATYNNGTTSTITLGGTTTAATSVTWSNDRGGSGSATNTGTSYSTWSISGITLSLGSNIITVTAGDGSTTVTDTITVNVSPAFPTTGVIDNFNRTENPLSDGGKWSSPIFAGDGTAQANGTRCVQGTGNFPEAYRNDQTYGPDCEAYVTIVTKGNTSGAFAQLGVRLRQENSAFDGYLLSYDSGSGVVEIYRVDNEAQTLLANTSMTLNAGDKIGIQCFGSTINAWRYDSGAGTWGQVLTANDATYSAAGHIGILFGSASNNWVFDDFGGGTLSAGTTPRTFSGTDSLAGGELL